MINIAICDDEKYISDKVKKLALDFFHRKNVEIKISQFGSGEELLRYNKSIDILFLDIQMDGIDGMETARKLRSQNYKGYLIFITVLKEMVFQAFEVQAYDYLVKPIEEEYFDKKMERLFASMQNANEANLLVQKGYESNIISFDDIIFCEIIDRKIYLHLKSGEVIDYYDRIENLETKLDGRFFKCHRSYIVNMKYIEQFTKAQLVTKNGMHVPVSRNNYSAFKEFYFSYMFQ